MKKLVLISALVASSYASANTPVDVTVLESLPIQGADSLAASGFQSVTAGQSVEKGQILVGSNGLEAYRATGEVVVKLAHVGDADKLAQTHGLTLKQAFRNYYIVTSSKENLVDVVSQLKKDGTVLSASIDLRDIGVSVK